VTMEVEALGEMCDDATSCIAALSTAASIRGKKIVNYRYFQTKFDH